MCDMVLCWDNLVLVYAIVVVARGRNVDDDLIDIPYYTGSASVMFVTEKTKVDSEIEDWLGDLCHHLGVSRDYDWCSRTVHVLDLSAIPDMKMCEMHEQRIFVEAVNEVVSCSNDYHAFNATVARSLYLKEMNVDEDEGSDVLSSFEVHNLHNDELPFDLLWPDSELQSDGDWVDIPLPEILECLREPKVKVMKPVGSTW